MESTHQTEIFWKGYNAYVMGGRDVKYVDRKRSNISVASGGWEPPESFSDSQKSEWRAGVDFAVKEREECAALAQGKRDGKDSGKRVNSEISTQIKAALASQKYTAAELAKMFNVSVATISRYGEKFGMKAMPALQLKKKVKNMKASPKKEEIIALLQSRTLNDVEISMKLGVSGATVANYRKKLGLTPVGRKPIARPTAEGKVQSPTEKTLIRADNAELLSAVITAFNALSNLFNLIGSRIR